MLVLCEFELSFKVHVYLLVIPSDISEIICFVLSYFSSLQVCVCLILIFQIVSIPNCILTTSPSESYLYQILLLQSHQSTLYYYNLTIPHSLTHPLNISCNINYCPDEKIKSLIAPCYVELVGPVLVCWDDYRYKNKRLVIDEYRLNKCEGYFTVQVVCRDLFGVLILMMNLQLENWSNKKNRSTDSAMLKIKKSTIGQNIHVNSFGKVDKSVCQFVVDFVSLALVFDLWSCHSSQFAPTPYVPGVPAAVYEHMQNNHEIIVHYLQSNQVSYVGKIVLLEF